MGCFAEFDERQTTPWRWRVSSGGATRVESRLLIYSYEKANTPLFLRLLGEQLLDRCLQLRDLGVPFLQILSQSVNAFENRCLQKVLPSKGAFKRCQANTQVIWLE
jgi:hypothetical protein